MIDTLHKKIRDLEEENLIKDKLEWNRQHFFSIDNALTIFNNLFEDLLKRDK